MQILLILIVALVVWFKFKKIIVKLWNSLGGDSKLQVVDQPTKHRDYSPAVRLSEYVHWTVLPAMGKSARIIKYNFVLAEKELLKSADSASEVVSTKVIGAVFAAKADVENKELFVLFFDEIAHCEEIELPLNEMLAAIKAGL